MNAAVEKGRMSGNMVLEPRFIGRLEELVKERTHHRVRDLTIAYQNDRIVLRGTANSFYLKQLAQHGILDVLPGVSLVNSIVVEQ